MPFVLPSTPHPLDMLTPSASQGTDVGKTLISTALCRASLAAGEKVAYIKPIGTGGGPGGAGDDGSAPLLNLYVVLADC